MKSKIVKSAVCEAVAIIWSRKSAKVNLKRVKTVFCTLSILHPGNEVGFCKRRYAFMNSTPTFEARKLHDQWRRYYLVILATHFYLGSSG